MNDDTNVESEGANREVVDAEISEWLETEQDRLDKRIAGSGLLLGLFWVLFVWGFWDKGFNALGINAGLFLLLFTVAQLKKGLFSDSQLITDISWELPLFLIAGSYILYENPFIKACNILAIPAMFGFILLRRSATAPEKMFFDGVNTAFLVFYAMLSPVGHIQRAVAAQWTWFRRGGVSFDRLQSPVAASVIKGLLIFLLLAMLLVIPLLSAADATFAAAFEEFYRWVEDFIIKIFEEEFVWKLVVIPLVSLVLLASSFAWSVEPGDVVRSKKIARERDSIVAGIVLGGIMLLYVLFLGIQLERLFLSSLPLEFKSTEQYVKQGFWQLVFLTTINLYLVFIYFKKTSQKAQYILISFTFVSLALLFSAAHRMLLYVVYYGLSYEKFYASYTVLYCVLLFALLAFAFFTPNTRNILRDAVYLLVWMYAIVCLLPTEKCIIVFNHSMYTRTETRLDMRDMNMLSIDALAYVKKHRASFNDRKSSSAGRWTDVDRWIERREVELEKKSWYEHTLASTLAAIMAD